MAIHPDFYPCTSPISAQELAQLADVTLVSGDGTQMISGAAHPAEASPGHLVLAASADYMAQCQNLTSCVIITKQDLAATAPEACTILVAENPRLAFAKALQHLYATSPTPRLAKSAKISSSAQIGKHVVIGPLTIIGPNVVIGDDVVIGAHCVIDAHCHIGDRSQIGDQVMMQSTRIGKDVKIASQTVIGKEGFGFEMTDKGAVRLPHLGLVTIDDGVNIGSHCAIDRGVLGDTKIGAHAMLDNHIHIAHNVVIGKNTLILAQTGIAGSAEIGENCIIGAQVGVKDHVSIASGSVILSGSKVTKTLDNKGTYAGFPAQPAKQHWREQVALRKLSHQK